MVQSILEAVHVYSFASQSSWKATPHCFCLKQWEVRDPPTGQAGICIQHAYGISPHLSNQRTLRRPDVVIASDSSIVGYQGMVRCATVRAAPGLCS